MKTKIKNKDLAQTLMLSGLLTGFKMPVNLTMAIVKSKKQMRTSFEDFLEAKKMIAESRCLKDAEGKPLLKFQKDKSGNDLENKGKIYAFENKEIETEALKINDELEDQEVEIELTEFNSAFIQSLPDCTPDQLEALFSFVHLID